MKTCQAVIDLYEIHEIQESNRDVHESLGLITAVALSPQGVELQNWLPLLAKQGFDFTFSNRQLASDFSTVTLAFYEQCFSCYQSLTPLNLPSELWLDENLQISRQGALFAIGFLSGFQSIEVMCNTLALKSGSESEHILQTTMLLLSKMASLNSDDPKMQILFGQLPSMVEIINAVPTLLSALGHILLEGKNE